MNSRDCLYSGRLVVRLWDSQCTERMQGEDPGTEGHLYVGRRFCWGIGSPCVEVGAGVGGGRA